MLVGQALGQRGQGPARPGRQPGAGVTVAVVDTGVQADLPELQGAVLPGIEYARNLAEYRDGHFVEHPSARAGDGRQDTSPYSAHGTAMAELIAGQGRGTGFLGVAPRARILPIAINNIGQIHEGIRYAVDHGAKVINGSTAGARPLPTGAARSCRRPSPTRSSTTWHVARRHRRATAAAAAAAGGLALTAACP